MLTPLRRALAVAVGLVAVTAIPAHAEYQPAQSYSDAAQFKALTDQVALERLLVDIGAEYVVAIQAQEAAEAAQKATQSFSRGSGGSLPYNQASSYQALANCEQGGRNHPYFGYFSIMDGSAGGKSWDEQVAMVQAIKSRAGAGAWDGCARYVP